MNFIEGHIKVDDNKTIITIKGLYIFISQETITEWISNIIVDDKLIKESDIDDITKYSLNSVFQLEPNQLNIIKIRLI